MFPAELYSMRRQALRDRLGGGLVLFVGASESPMNFRANPYPFIQDSSFNYFFGLREPGLVGVMDLDEGGDTLFADDDDLDYVLWHGPRPALRERAAAAGIDQVRPAADASDLFAEAAARGRAIHFLPAYRDETALRLSGLVGARWDEIAKRASVPLTRAVVALREIKSVEEIAEIEAALAVTARIHLAAMQGSRDGRHEYEVVGEMEGIIRSHDRLPSYPIIFSKHGEVLHNFSHKERLATGDLVINDSGATSPLGYASDITRTFPVGGKFSQRQRDIYEIVLAAQQGAIDAMRPGVPFLDVHKLAARIITEGLIGLGILRGDPGDLVEQGVHAIVFQSGLGHQLGLDVHDMEGLGEEHVGYGDGFRRSSQFGLNHLRMAKPLQCGMVMTVEPGIYFIGPLIARWEREERFRGVIDYTRLRTYIGFGGVRIEDDVLVAEGDARPLGPHIARTIEEVETAMSA